MVTVGEKPWVRVAEISDEFGLFVLEPLPRGYGATLGNSLRRILLSSLPGAAITAVKIEDAAHEFSVIPGVVEDALHIMLNLKGVVIRSHSDQPKVVKLKAKGKGEVKAGDIEHDAEIEIVNPDMKIATLDSNGKLNMELIVERGKGYVSAERNKKSNLPSGYIPIDSIFTPILKVNLSTEEMRVGQEINYDRLVLSVWSNGSIKPDDAVKESAKILVRYVDFFVRLGEKTETLGLETEGKEEIPSSALEMNIEDLELTSRSLNCLKKMGIKTVGDLIGYSEADLSEFKNFGTRSLNEVRRKLAEYKLTLKGEAVPSKGEKP
ncbi:DNA-directed RNA polymerase subunit alpha [Candidatus Saganbacteria bacterium]|uniref:DNA-directed RNA polymerase subunit alpha n=1 Tax=Candidatus Saganbacteria bacterium TaxID=2575572 RepID=A0A9D6YT40_UNCSA|nr:DNA-directed RNA polymerase subunit alpha [Candidatus Saganbacteria bacterium]